MSPQEAARSALENLASHKLRSSLSMLGMIFGVGAVIAMLSIGAGAERQALDTIDRMGLRNVLVRDKPPREEERPEIRKKSQGVSPRDAQAVLEGVPGVVRVAPKVTIEPYKVLAAGTKAEDVHVYGVAHDHQRLAHLEVGEGRFLDSTDEARHAQVAVIGPGIRRDLFGYEPALGRDIKVNDVWLEVVGVLATGQEAANLEGVPIPGTAREIYVPYTAVLRKFDRDPMDAPLDELVVELNAETSPTSAAPVIRGLLSRLHAGAEDFEIVVPEALLEQSRKTQRLFNIVMGCIAGISLLVGGIGIMNIMLATVLERTREIGVRRAVGARQVDIRTQFLYEAFSISTMGGLAGVVMGLVIAKTVAAFAGWPTVITFASIFLSTGVSVGVGLASGIYPAIRAAALDPIEALRYE
jgi:putative ABC transport system permease protein